MVDFSTDTQAAIDRTKSRTESGASNADAVGFAQDVGIALAGMRDELGDASLSGATGGTGDVLRADDDQRLPVASLPSQIGTDNLPVGTAAGQIPVLDASGRIQADLLGVAGGESVSLTNKPTTDQQQIFTAVGRHTYTFADYAATQGLFVIAVGAGGGASIDRNTFTNANDASRGYLGLKGEVVSGLIPKSALDAAVDANNQLSVLVGNTTPSPDWDRRTPFMLQPAEPSGIDNLILAEGGPAWRVILRPTETEVRGMYDGDARTGATIPGLDNPSNTLRFYILVRGFGGDDTIVTTRRIRLTATGWGAPGQQGVVAIWEIH